MMVVVIVCIVLVGLFICGLFDIHDNDFDN